MPSIASDQAAFLAAIRAAPDDDTPRLVYADWLQEQEERKCPEPCFEFGGRWVTSDRAVLSDGSPKWTPAVTTCERCHGSGRINTGFAERAEQIRNNSGIRYMNPWNWPSKPYRYWLDGRAGKRNRGLIEEIRCSWAVWLAHHQEILSHPDVVLRRVELTTWPDWAWIHQRASDIGRNRGLSEAVENLRAYLSEEFPGHCCYEEDGQTRWHPIEWVLPGDTTAYLTLA